MKFKTFILAALVAVSSHSLALTEKSSTLAISDVSKDRMHSVNHMSSAAHNLYMFWVNGLSDNCESLFLFADDDPFLFSSVLSGLSNSNTQNIQVYYHTDVRGPWGDQKSCQLTSFTVLR
jgi:hypothetical protein